MLLHFILWWKLGIQLASSLNAISMWRICDVQRCDKSMKEFSGTEKNEIMAGGQGREWPNCHGKNQQMGPSPTKVGYLSSPIAPDFLAMGKFQANDMFRTFGSSKENQDYEIRLLEHHFKSIWSPSQSKMSRPPIWTNWIVLCWSHYFYYT